MGKVVRLDEYSDNLSVGTKLLNGQFTIEKFINNGGFGITYLARNSLDKLVVIKECYPNAICRRSNTAVAARSAKHEPDFENAKEIFVREAQNLARLDHPNIVQVHQVFDENNTAYMVIDYVDGRDLQEMIEQDPNSLTPEFLVDILTKLLSAVRATHAEKILHRDISPDNVLINKEGDPVLIDFGAARDDVSKKSRVLSTLNVIKDGYSPQEFYVAGSLQSDSSDLYALGATMYHCISGSMPPNSQLRLAAVAEGREGPYVPLDGRFEGYPENFLGAIDTALQVIPKDRLQSAKEWSELIDPQFTRELRSALTATGKPKQADGAKRKKIMLASGAVAAVLCLGFVGFTMFGSNAPETSQASQNDQNEQLTTQPKGENLVAVVETPTPQVKETLAQPKEIVLVDPFETLQKSGSIIAPQSLAATAFQQDDIPADLAIKWGVSDLVVGGAEVTVEPNNDIAVAPRAEAAVTETEKLKPTPLPLSRPEPKEPVVATNETIPDTKDEQPVVQEFKPQVQTPKENLFAGLENAPDKVDTLAVVPDRARTNIITDLESVPDRAEDNATALSPVFELIAPAQPKPEPVVQETEQAALQTTTVPEPAQQPTKTALKISISDWKLELPFLLGDAVTAAGTGSFPVVTALKQRSDVKFAGDWIKPGVTIYAINGELLPPSDKVEAFLENAFDAGPVSVSTTARISRGKGAPAEDVVLQLGFSQTLSFSNGLQVKQKRVEGEWAMVVTKLPLQGSVNLALGDILIKERGVGVDLTSVQAMVSMFKLLNDNGIEQADFAIKRGQENLVGGLRL